MLKLSIVVPVYNVEKYIEKCLRSCAEQNVSPNDYEIIVINDGSPDNSLEIVERVAKDYRNVIVVSQENKGLSEARNKGLSLARGDYIWFVDSDDWIEKNCLERLLDLCFQHHLDILHFCAANAIGEECVRRYSYSTASDDVMPGKEALLKGVHSPCAPFSIYKRNFLLDNALSFYPGIFHEDSEFMPRAWYAAKKVLLIDDICYYTNQNPNSITRSVNPKKAFDIIKVCESLDKFCMSVDDKYKIYFHNEISMYINNSLSNSYAMGSSDDRKLNLEWKNHSYLFKHLRLSNKQKYHLEYYLFCIFPFYCQIYKLIQHLNRR